MQCPACGAQNSPGTHSCQRCGAGLPTGPTGTSFVIGRDPSCDIVLPTDDTRVSRRHAKITVLAPGRFLIEDLGSSNGVQVDGRAVQRAELGPRSLITFGTYHLDTSFLGRLHQASPAAPPAAQGQGHWLIIGRDPGCDITLPFNLDGISRQHARIRQTGAGHYELEDLGSANGVYVNGARTQRCSVTASDTVGLGSSTVQVVQLAQDAAPRPAPGPMVPAPGPGSPPQVGPPAHRAIPPWAPIAAVFALLVVGLGIFWAYSQGGSGFGDATARREVLSPTEALERMERTLEADGDLDAHFQAYELVAQELEPVREWVLEADLIYSAFVELSEAEVMGVQVWDNLVDTNPYARVAELFFQAVGKAVTFARTLSDQLHDLPASVQTSSQALHRAQLEPSASSVLEARSALNQTASQLETLRNALAPFQSALDTVVSDLDAAGDALHDLSDDSTLGTFAAIGEGALRDLERPFGAAAAWIDSFRGALRDDAATLGQAVSAIDQVDIR